MSAAFWEEIDRLCSTAKHVIDRPAGSAHPRFREWVYPLAYGYLDGTMGGDGEGIDVWFGTAGEERTSAIACTVDPYKRDSEVKYLWRCTAAEVAAVRSFYEGQPMKVLLVERQDAHVLVNVAGSEVAEDLARLWVRANARRRQAPIPASPEPDRVTALAERVGRPGAAAVVALQDDVAVACCFFEPLTEPDGETRIEGAAHLSGVAVEPGRWGEGLGVTVLDSVEAEVRRRGYRLLRLHVLEENERARCLYERQGWILVATGHPHPAGPQAVYDKLLTQ